MKFYITNILTAIASLVTLPACVDNMNTDPNNPASVPTTSLITASEKMLVDNLRGEQASLRSSMLFVQYFSLNTYTANTRYDIPFGYSETYWHGVYKTLNNLEEIIKLNTHEETKDQATANGAGSNASQIAIARILKSYAFYGLTDVFGNVPYESYGSDDPDFEALEQDPDNITPKYASQEKIYADILSELQQAANTLLADANGNTFGSADIIYGGDNHKWAKFANSLRLRFATRLKEKENALYRQHFADALSKGVFTGNADNAVFTYSTYSPNEAPLYRATVTANRKDFAVSKVLVELLRGDNPVLPLSDPRLPVYADPAGDSGEYIGLPYGLTEAQAGSFAATSVSLPGAIVNAANYGEVLMEYAEVAFLLSEYNNWSQEEYMAGVRASLDKWGVGEAEATEYIAQLPAASRENVLLQKYIALYMQGIEAWSEYRRTGYPDFLITRGDVNFEGILAGEEVRYTFDPLFGNGGIPARLYYPQKEQNVNRSNYQQAIAVQGVDRIETPLWVFR